MTDRPRSFGRAGRYASLLVLALAATEAILMITPFAAYFYSSFRFESLLGALSRHAWTAWLGGFFLNHSVITTSPLLEWQRKLGEYMLALGIWGFAISAFQVYGNKLTGRGVAKGLLYRLVRHPQYLCLAIAGWGLLTIWPRFLLLAAWITMLFLYAGLARFEESRMTERFGESYRAFARTRGAFLPGSPVSRMFERVFGFIRAPWLRWTTAYLVCLVAAFAAAFALLAHTRSHTAQVWLPDHRAVAISVWPKSAAWISGMFRAALDDERVRGRIAAAREDKPLVVTILPPRYSMTGMYYVLDHATAGASAAPVRKIDLDWLAREAVYLLLPIEPFARKYYLGIDPDGAHEPVEVVFSRADKPYKSGLELEEVLDPGVRLTPLVIADVLPGTTWVTDVRIPLPRNRWGADVPMPVF